MLPEVESLRVQSFVASLPSREEPDISLSIINSKACFYTHALACISTSPKRGSVLNTCSSDFIHSILNV